MPLSLQRGSTACELPKFSFQFLVRMDRAAGRGRETCGRTGPPLSSSDAGKGFRKKRESFFRKRGEEEVNEHLSLPSPPSERGRPR